MAPSDDPPHPWRLFGGMKMGVNIWVTGADGERMPIFWGVGLVPNKASDSGYVINFMSDDKALTVRETPAEIMALVKEAQRKRDRMTIAAQILASTMPLGHHGDRHADAVKQADALLAALDAREGAE